MPDIAVIFDLDGTLIDNNSFHIKAWQEFYKKRNRTLTEGEYKEHFNGKTNTDVLAYVFEQPLSPQENEAYTNEKEDLYRVIYEPHIQPVKGLFKLLQQLQNAKISMAIATSGIKVNIDYMFNHLDIKHFFKEVIYSKDIKKGKPDPEIYFITAQKLRVLPENCIVFEDSVAGIQSAKAAGMKVVAIATTHTPAELTLADKLIYDYDEISITDIDQLLKNK
ncbi:MAG TPA: HAD family phosphatase [Chitinophagaceae bacterium]|nr:HAD family phosphatase [Chitinophagaceae bacterium]